MFYRCAVCNTTYMNKGAEPIMQSVPYVAKLEDSYCCAVCVTDHEGRGKFEACQGSRGELGKALILYAWSQESGEDDFMSSEGYGYCGKFGQYLLFEDDRGSVAVWDEGTAEKAQWEFDRLYSEGMGASEDDAYISYDRGRYYVSMSGKELHVWPNNFGELTERRCIARVRLEAMKTGYWPSLWLVGERGDMREGSY
jgi:hypothetical protein